MTLHTKLDKKIKLLKIKYAKVTALAKLLPIFEDEIIRQEGTGDEFFRLSNRYKTMPLNWGINWHVGKPSNYPEPSCPYKYVSVYINACDLFDRRVYDFAHQELGCLIGSIKVSFYDALNTTFYFLPDEVESGLENLYGWFINVKTKSDEVIKAAELSELESRIAKLKGQ